MRQLQKASEKVKVTEGLAHSLCKEEHVCIGECKVISGSLTIAD